MTHSLVILLLVSSFLSYVITISFALIIHDYCKTTLRSIETYVTVSVLHFPKSSEKNKITQTYYIFLDSKSNSIREVSFEKNMLILYIDEPGLDNIFYHEAKQFYYRSSKLSKNCSNFQQNSNSSVHVRMPFF